MLGFLRVRVRVTGVVWEESCIEPGYAATDPENALLGFRDMDTDPEDGL